MFDLVAFFDPQLGSELLPIINNDWSLVFRLFVGRFGTFVQALEEDFGLNVWWEVVEDGFSLNIFSKQVFEEGLILNLWWEILEHRFAVKLWEIQTTNKLSMILRRLVIENAVMWCSYPNVHAIFVLSALIFLHGLFFHGFIVFPEVIRVDLNSTALALSFVICLRGFVALLRCNSNGYQRMEIDTTRRAAAA